MFRYLGIYVNILFWGCFVRNLNITQIGICYDAYLLADFVIPLGFEPKTHSLEGCCSNPTELRNRNSGAKLIILFEMTKYFLIFLSQT